MIRKKVVDNLSRKILELISETDDITPEEMLVAATRIPGYILYTFETDRIAVNGKNDKVDENEVKKNKTLLNKYIKGGDMK